MEKKALRINKLIEVLKLRNGATVSELAALMNVSEMTIRRDLKVLNENGIITLVHGGAIYNPESQIDQLRTAYRLEQAASAFQVEKDRIGRLAASLVEPGDTIVIDTGTTTEALARSLDPQHSIRVICYNTNILNTLLCKENVSLAMAGGYYHPNTQMFESAQGVAFIGSLRANKVFLSAAGVHEPLGITCADEYEVDTKRAVLNCGAERILLADSSKFSVVKQFYFASLSSFDTVITDTGLPPAWRALLQDRGIRLLLA